VFAGLVLLKCERIASSDEVPNVATISRRGLDQLESPMVGHRWLLFLDVGMGYIDKTPIPNARQFPQFKIVVKKRKLKPPTAKQVEKVLAAATGRVKMLCEMMRWSAQ